MRHGLVGVVIVQLTDILRQNRQIVGMSLSISMAGLCPEFCRAFDLPMRSGLDRVCDTFVVIDK